VKSQRIWVKSLDREGLAATNPHVPRRDRALVKDDVVGHTATDHRFGGQDELIQIILTVRKDESGPPLVRTDVRPVSALRTTGDGSVVRFTLGLLAILTKDDSSRADQNLVPGT